MNSRILRIALATLAVFGLCCCLFILDILFFFQLHTEGPLYALVYVIVVVGVVFVFSSKQTALVRTIFLSCGMATLVGLEYRRSGWSLYIFTTALVRAGIAVGALCLAWLLLRHVFFYYKKIFVPR
jgi:hypothetical protein